MGHVLLLGAPDQYYYRFRTRQAFNRKAYRSGDILPGRKVSP
jgi:hypothetical protein